MHSWEYECITAKYIFKKRRNLKQSTYYLVRVSLFSEDSLTSLLFLTRIGLSPNALRSQYYKRNNCSVMRFHLELFFFPFSWIYKYWKEDQFVLENGEFSRIHAKWGPLRLMRIKFASDSSAGHSDGPDCSGQLYSVSFNCDICTQRSPTLLSFYFFPQENLRFAVMCSSLLSSLVGFSLQGATKQTLMCQPLSR